MSAPRHPLLIIGLDGATFSVLDALGARGMLPALTRLSDEGLRTELRSTMPPATLPAWTSFLTGADPGHHGVTDMLMRRPGGYELQPAGGRLRALPTFLQRLSRAGLRVASLGVPGTFPPEPLRGICIAGFDSPGAHRAMREAVWPPSLWPELEQLGGWRYATFNEQAGGPRKTAAAASALLEDIARKERIILELYQREPWDVFFVHLQASDTAAHHLWHTYDVASPRHRSQRLSDALPRVYARLDALIGRLLAASRAGTRVLVVSDHGMGGASDVAVHLNRVLAEAGLLCFRSPAGAALRRNSGRALRRLLERLPPELIGAATRWTPTALVGPLLGLARGTNLDLARSLAFSDELDYAPSVWINRRGLFPEGTVEPEEVELLCRRVEEAVLSLRDPRDGARLVRRVHRRETTGMQGPFLERAPDLLIEPAWPRGYRPSFLTSPGPGPGVRLLAVDELDAGRGAGMPGVHRAEGVFLAWGEGLPAMELPALSIAEAGAAVYALAGEPVPGDLQRRLPGFLGELLGSQVGDGESAMAVSMQAFAPEEEAVVTERLRRLGYLE